MESSPSAMLKFLLPRTPFILKTALWHALHLSPTASKWDLKTELTVLIIRQLIDPSTRPSSISKVQKLTCRDPGIKGKMWISKVRFDAAQEDDARQMVLKAVEDLKDGGEKYTIPENKPLEAEWTGFRAGVGDHEPEPTSMSEAEKYSALMKETSSKVTILYFHGGAMYLLDPATYRIPTSRIAKATGGRVFNVRYRLSPQNPFPAALLDAFTAYLSLLSPPEGAPHEAIPANEIVFSGDSAGGMLCLSLQQLLLQIHRSNPDQTKLPTVKFNGKDVEMPLPAGLALTSPWLDVTRSLPSLESLAKFDYLPPPSKTHHVSFRPCEAWPANPPRADLYCEGEAMLHPLVSPLAAKDWSHCPPILFILGQEMLLDEDSFLAQQCVAQGVKVVYRMFEAMPHVFGYMLDGNPAARLSFVELADFAKAVVEGNELQNSYQVLEAKTLKRRELQVDDLTDLTEEKVRELMVKGRERLMRRFMENGEPSLEARPML